MVANLSLIYPYFLRWSKTGREKLKSLRLIQVIRKLCFILVYFVFFNFFFLKSQISILILRSKINSQIKEFEYDCYIFNYFQLPFQLIRSTNAIFKRLSKFETSEFARTTGNFAAFCLNWIFFFFLFFFSKSSSSKAFYTPLFIGAKVFLKCPKQYWI